MVVRVKSEIILRGREGEWWARDTQAEAKVSSRLMLLSSKQDGNVPDCLD